jgi:hypothetical protein
MSTATLEPTQLFAAPSDWEAAAGPIDTSASARAAQPTKVYRGHTDEHWRGQTCHVVGASTQGELNIILACGCRASVPWWTLEPINA